jgi:hypothetical protein
MILAVAVRFCLWPLTGEHGAGGSKIAGVDVLNKIDDIAALAAAAAIPKLFFSVDAESIGAGRKFCLPVRAYLPLLCFDCIGCTHC